MSADAEASERARANDADIFIRVYTYYTLYDDNARRLYS